MDILSISIEIALRRIPHYLPDHWSGNGLVLSGIVDPGLCHHIVSPNHNELNQLPAIFYVSLGHIELTKHDDMLHMYCISTVIRQPCVWWGGTRVMFGTIHAYD